MAGRPTQTGGETTIATARMIVAPRLFRWAVERSGRRPEELAAFPLAAWETGAVKPTMKQLEAFARATYTPVGFLFLDEPPAESVPILDFRTFRDAGVRRASANLLDTIYTAQQRQDWYREYAESHGVDEVSLIDSCTLETPPREGARLLRAVLRFGLDDRAGFASWTAALTGLTERAEQAGVLVMTSGVVGSNTQRRLEPDEFRGFALADALAPVVFVNGADTKAAQIFTLAHELAHLLLGESAVSRPELSDLDDSQQSERWCNDVAAELLVPADDLRVHHEAGSELTPELDRLARLFKVSSLVVLRRLAEAGLLARAQYRAAYDSELARVLALASTRSSGGSFYNTTPVRVSKRFARALISDTLEGRTSHRDAYRLLGSKRFSAFEELGHRLGVA